MFEARRAIETAAWNQSVKVGVRQRGWSRAACLVLFLVDDPEFRPLGNAIVSSEIVPARTIRLARVPKFKLLVSARETHVQRVGFLDVVQHMTLARARSTIQCRR